ncbi:MAG: hypothetical protein ACTHJT_12100, partial [Cytophaga sp.]|uniref:hypothetical protein n=1 Tax=Cytophaga sp. TaxID=29535 RepID=UPI003F7DAD77
MNYIKHLNKVLEIMNDDPRLSPAHISLYMALFQQWNHQHFKIPMAVNRIDIMNAAKIGSFTTYTKYLKELHEWDYINYAPSFNARDSPISMYNFCNQIPVDASIAVHPTQIEVVTYFNDNKWQLSEAKKFFFYYEATGWRTKTQQPITDWKAAARKWILNRETVNSN